ncbi:hypothetical protein [Euryhalocaulis caribicus]|uniref:hypothetical protein n=1 Tax=Euryhalocaulis caribicus TaxID=1161401 RepID=UPI00039C09A7|nr:hypothetical protein [Euryhalocaulis caribicus]
MSAAAEARRRAALNATRLTRLARAAGAYAFTQGTMPPPQGVAGRPAGAAGGGRDDLYARDVGVHLAVCAFGLTPARAGADSGMTPAASEAAHLMFAAAREESPALDRYFTALCDWLAAAPPAWGARGGDAASKDSPGVQPQRCREPAAKQGRASRAGSGDRQQEARKRVNPASVSSEGGA